ncbi:hypothetical protein DEU38_121114 [Rhodococcus sp. AG1013]|nr:hypothetical protein DEU38_121114 [Rhodococcus sp. AG1013]
MVADALHGVRTTTGALTPDDLPIADYDELNVSAAVAEMRELTEAAGWVRRRLAISGTSHRIAVFR